MPLLKLDDHELSIPSGTPVLKAALDAGIEIPHYCYHEALSIVGSCRLCMVEVDGMPKLQTSCSTYVNDLPHEKKIDRKYDMVVHTRTQKVKAARKLSLEFLLLNHPLDCPVCDQAGECLLQDYAFKYGSAHSRFIEQKRVRPNEDLGSGVVINQNRCILCTRCVRFTSEVSGTSELLIQNRGYHNKVAIFEDHPLNNPLAGNVADICPVGALLLKDYIHTTRVWHLSHTPSTCTECTVGCSLTVDAYQNRVYRVISRTNLQANGHFICDYGRYAFHKYNENRLTAPVFKVNGKWKKVTWGAAFKTIEDRMNGSGGGTSVSGLASPTFTNEANYLLGRIVKHFEGKTQLRLLPVQESEDQEFPGFRISGDTGGNRRGVLDVAGAIAETGTIISKGNPNLLIVLDGDGRGVMSNAVEALFKAAAFKVVLSSNGSPFTEAADLVLPVGDPFQRDGTVTNEKGLVQWVQAALPPMGEARPEWEVLSQLKGRLTGDSAEYASAAEITAEIAQNISGYAGLTRFKLGALGVFKAGSGDV